MICKNVFSHKVPVFYTRCVRKKFIWKYYRICYPMIKWVRKTKRVCSRKQ